MTTPYEDGAGYIIGDDFTTITDRYGVIETRLVGGVGRYVAGGSATSIIDVGAFYPPASSIPGWAYNATTHEFIIPEPGTYEFAIRMGIDNAAPSVGNAVVGVSAVNVATGAAYSINTTTIVVGSGYFLDATRQVVVPVSGKYAFTINLSSAATTGVLIEQNSIAYIRRVL